MTTPFQEVPIIDISGLYSQDLNAQNEVAGKMRNALMNVGFMQIQGHKVSPNLISELVDVSKQFFDLPLDEKMQYYIGKSPYHKGYVPEGEEIFSDTSIPDHKEALDLARDLDLQDPKVIAKVPMHGPNLWPTTPTQLKRVVSEYYQAVYELGQVLIKGFALALQISYEEFAQCFTEPMAGMRLVHYPPNLDTEANGIGEHCDYECFTILLCTAPGLEVKNSANQWVAIDPQPNTFVINTGDVLDCLTNGTFKATSHRVQKVKQERFSFPMFYGCNYDTVVEPLPHFQTGSSENTNFNKMVAGDHLWSSMIQTYRYLRIKLQNNEISLPK